MSSRVDVKILERHAETIPSQGGRKIGEYLRAAARDVAVPETAVVELGCWMGSGTAFLSLGLRERQDAHNITIHCFDYYRANGPEVRKARAGNIEITRGQNTLPLVKELLAPFDSPIVFHKGSIERAAWSGTPISVYVQDAGKDPYSFFAMIKKFGPSWIPEKTVLFLMDYYHWRKTGEQFHRCQTDFVEANPECFSIPVPLHGSCVMLRYLKRYDFSKIRARWLSRNALPLIRQALR